MPVEQYTTSQLVCADVLEWAATYDGPPFHAMLCDPPYGLGFMGKSWDKPATFVERKRGTDAWDHVGGNHNPSNAQDAARTHYRENQRLQEAYAVWFAALARHLLPGAFVMAFASSRGWHRLACALEDAGLIIHPSIFNYRTGETLEIGMYGWSNGAGFPKATRIDTAVDAAAGAEREAIDYAYAARKPHGTWTGHVYGNDAPHSSTAPATPLAQAWEGHRYGLQALKPALEPIIVAQVPYAGRPVDSITATGAGALWIEGGRIGTDSTERRGYAEMGYHGKNASEDYDTGSVSGRWPPNFALCHLPTCQPLGTKQVQTSDPYGSTRYSKGVNGHEGWQRKAHAAYQPTTSHGYAAPDGTETVQAYACSVGCPVRAFDLQAGERSSGDKKLHHIRHNPKGNGVTHGYMQAPPEETIGDSGPASRFFFTADFSLDVAEQLAHADPVYYCPKASASERHQGLDRRNDHPTVKPLTLLRWLATLLLPPAAYAPRRLLVPFCGTGSEMIGGILAGWEAVLGIEQDHRSVDAASQRLAWWTGRKPETSMSPQDVQPSVPTSTHAQLSLF